MQRKWILFTGLSAIVFLAASSLIAVSDEISEETLKIHRKQCKRCHGERGQGDGPAGKILKVKPADWTDMERMSEYSEDDLFKVIKDGGLAVGRSKQMPGFAAKLKDEEIRDLIAFIKSLQAGN